MHPNHGHRRVPAGAPFQQVCALPYQVQPGGRLLLLLVTSRTTRRWILPKGWPMKGIRPHRAAAIEAYEEAGVTGRSGKEMIGEYLYFKRLEATFVVCNVRVFGLQVDRIEAQWPECRQRERAWFDCATALELVEEPGLTSILSTFASRHAGRGSESAAAAKYASPAIGQAPASSRRTHLHVS